MLSQPQSTPNPNRQRKYRSTVFDCWKDNLTVPEAVQALNSSGHRVTIESVRGDYIQIEDTFGVLYGFNKRPPENEPSPLPLPTLD